MRQGHPDESECEMSDLYECCDHCLLWRGVCPDREENGGHMASCPEGCKKGTKVISS